MNLKDRIIICLTVVFVIIFAYLLKSNANVMGQTTDRALADYANQDIYGFLNSQVESNWFTYQLDEYISKGETNGATINRSSAACLYHTQSSTGTGKYLITNVIDIGWDKDISNYKVAAYWNGGNQTLNLSEQGLRDVDMFAQAVYNAYNLEGDTVKVYNYTTTEKAAMKALFFDKAISSGGFLNGLSGISELTAGEASREGSSYVDKGGGESVSDLITTYGQNVTQGYGIINQDFSSIDLNGNNVTNKQKDSDQNYTIFGPFNIDFSQPIEAISVVGNTKNITGYNGGEIYYSTSFNKYDTATWVNDFTYFPKNENFYIRVLDNGQDLYEKSSNITITFSQKQITTYHNRVLLLRNLAAKGQNLMIYAGMRNADYAPSIQYIVGNAVAGIADLTVEKRGENENLQAGVGFYLGKDGERAYAQWETKELQNGVTIYSNVTFKSNIDSEKQVFETGSSGKFIIKDLNVSNTYVLQEMRNSNQGYQTIDIKSALLANESASISIGNSDESNKKKNDQIKGIKLSTKQDNVLRVVDNSDEGFDIIINKINPSKTKIKGAQFKIKVLDGSRTIGWLSCDNTEHKNYIYSKSYNSSSIWNTAKKVANERIDGNIIYSKEQGIIEILNLDEQYNYEIYETKPAEGYLNLYAHTLYGVDTKIDGTKKTLYRESYVYDYSAVDCGTVSYKQHGSSVTVEVTNVHAIPDAKYVDISGVVWMDRNIKTSNNRFDTGEGLSGVVVYLRKADSKAQKAKTTTNSSGVYTFMGSSTRLTSEDLKDYYIEIAYNGIGTNYRITEYGTGNNYSKAKHQSAGVAGTDTIESNYRMHMNIGLRPISKNTQSVEKWVDNVKIVMKGNEYTYKYGKDNTSVGGGTTVGIGNASYYRTIYASDIAYSLEENVTDGLQVYITYKIKVNNDTSTYQPARVIGNKKEEFMTVTLKDEYDSTCYELYDNNWSESNGVATYNSTIKLNRAKTSGYTRTIPITFKLTDGKTNTTRNVLKKILEDKSFTAGNKVTISGYHQYKRYTHHCGLYSCWNSWDTYYSSYQEENYAPGMTFSINEYGSDTVLERTISGKVFEDTNIMPQSDGQILGNGLYDNSASRKESIIQNVVVELLNANTNKVIGQGTPAKRYEYIKADGQVHIKTQSINTLNDGTYIFTGMVPGDYYVRFTYGNGTQRIEKINPSGMEPVRAYYYKSTIVKNSTLKNLIKKDGKRQLYSDNEYYWYRNISADGWSTAVDVLGDRENLNSQNSLTYNIRAYTPTLRIGLENESATSGENKAKVYDIKNINFGIIDTPKVSLGFEKKMTNIKVTNSQGNVLIDGNPETVDESIKYLSDLDDKEYLTPGSDYAKIEINDNEIYGAKLEIEYSITVINNSDINYYERAGSQYYGYYYMFGEKYLTAAEKHKTREVNITINKVYDYLDNKLTFTGEKDHGISNENTYKDNDSVLYIDDNWKPIYSQIRAATNSRPTQDIAKFKVTRTLSNTESDMNFENYAIVQDINVTDNPRLVEDLNIHGTTENKTVNTMEPSTKDVKYTNYFDYSKSGVTFANLSEVNSLTVVPPTGYDMLTPIIYIMVIIIAGIIITISIIVIKKKVI